MRRSLVVVFGIVVATAGLLPAITTTGASAGALSLPTGPLKGVFSIQSGRCSLVGAPTGSYLQLLEHGVPVPNVSSPCPLTSSTYTPLKTGDIGLVSGAYQDDPSPTFNGGGNSLAASIVKPVSFLGVGFGMATTCADQQHHATTSGACPPGGKGFAVPQLYAEPIGTGGCKLNLANVTGALNECLYGNLESLGVTYNGPHDGTCASAGANNNGCYDVGAASGPSLQPTGCGSAPLGGCSLSGSINPVNSSYTLNVQSTIIGTAFNGATAELHLVGTYKPGIPAHTTSPTSPGSNPPPPSTTTTSTTTPPPPPASSGVSGQLMTGTFAITSGSCTGSGAPSGSWIQLGLGGSPIKNPDSACDGGTYTPLSQGTTGLQTGRFQPDPTPTFDASGNSLADAIITPTSFLGSKFGAATDPTDEQTAPTGADVFPAPQAVLRGGTITANLSAVNFTYNGATNGTCASGAGDGCYAVGSPDVAGTYDPASRTYMLQWTATIHGGAFNNATATFHLQGIFTGTIAAAATTLSSAGRSVPAAATGAVAAAASRAVPTSSGPAGITPSAVPQANKMVGTFTITSGGCTTGTTPTGSWIQLAKGGGPIPNPASSCDGGNYTLLSQGSSGLQTGHFQPNPSPTFDANGNSLAGAIIQPTKFLGADFGAATNPTNQQNAPDGPDAYPAPFAVLAAGQRSFTANLSSLNFTYNGTPNGTCSSGNGVGCYAVGSADVAGTYNPASHAYAMAWTGTVVGGAFNGASATFHLTGVFEGTITKVAASSVPVSGSTPAPTPKPQIPAPSPGGATAEAVTPFPVPARASLPGSGWATSAEAVISVLVGAGLLGAGLVAGGLLRRPRLFR